MKDYKPLKSLKTILHNKEKAIRLCLFKANKHSKREAFEVWEQNEHGSVNGMLNAYEVMTTIPFDKKLSIEIIEQIRVELFKDSTYGNINCKDSNNINNLTDKASSFFLSFSSKDEREQINAEAKILKDRFELENLPYECKGLKFIPNEEIQTRLQYFNKIIEEYNREEKTRENILKTVRDLERLHPYNDFNCRTFAVLVLNRELIKEGFSPCIMEDPNMFDYKSIEDLGKLVKEGQENFASLHKSSLVHKDDPTNQQWYNALSENNKKEFHTVTQNYYISLDELNAKTPEELLESLDEYIDRYEKPGIKIEHANQLENLTEAGFSLNLLKEINANNQEYFKWLIKNNQGINYLKQWGMSKENLVKKYMNPNIEEFLKDFIFCCLKKKEEDNKKIQDLLDSCKEDPAKEQFYLSNMSALNPSVNSEIPDNRSSEVSGTDSQYNTVIPQEPQLTGNMSE